MARPGPLRDELRHLTGDRSGTIAGMATLDELSGIHWAIKRGFSAPLSEAEQAAYARRMAELQRRETRR
ncbi:MAG: hypothetical protein GY717_06935 [Rhodobacteraceae bacterium]|nr:hypothetical protein [Paracoccaceae bacterium]